MATTLPLVPREAFTCQHLKHHGDRLECRLGGRCEPGYTNIAELHVCPQFVRVRRKGDKLPEVQQPMNSLLPCVHLGERLKRDDGFTETAICPTCPQVAGQDRKVAVHACAIHGRCVTNGAPHGLKSCQSCAEYRSDAYQLTVNAEGIGDHLQACAIGAAWKDVNPGKRLHLVARHSQWASLFSDAFDSISTMPLDQATNIHTHLNDRGGLHFIEAAAQVFQKRRPTQRPLPQEALDWAEQYRGCVVLAPISLGSGSGRNWLKSHWQVLERMLIEAGSPTVAIAAGTDGDRLTGFAGQVILGKPAAHVAALMKVARLVISNESGMGHLAGALNVPCVVLAAQLIAAPIYACWPSVRVIQGPLGCGGCRWTGPNWSSHCDTICANLQAISPEQVFAEVQQFLEPAGAPFVSDLDLDRQLQGHLSKLIVPNPAASLCPLTLADRRPTMNLFLRSLKEKTNPNVLETGCQRADLDYGAGMSTTLIGLFLKGHGGSLRSLDHEINYVNLARARTTDAGLPVEVIHTDSRFWLENYTGPAFDGFYSDSQDTWMPGYQECCLEEMKLTVPHLAADAIIMVDDTWKQSDGYGGKGAKAVPWLVSQGWRVVLDGWQVVLKR